MTPRSNTHNTKRSKSKTAPYHRQSIKKTARKRFPPAERERMIVEAAIQFFAEEGFHGRTRALADRVGITHSVLYRYFPNKNALIDRVYKEVYLRRWNPDWTEMISDRRRTFEERLAEFYVSYADAIFDSNWVRIFMAAGLMNINISRRYYTHVRKHILIPLCAELRHDSNLPSFETVPLLEKEEELFWSLHGGIFFIAIRKFIYGVDVPAKIEPVVRAIVSQFLAGASRSISSLIDHKQKKPRN